MAGNEVTIRVTADNDTRRGFDSVRRDADSLGDHFERSGTDSGHRFSTGLLSTTDGIDDHFGRTGDDSGHKFGKGILDGTDKSIGKSLVKTGVKAGADMGGGILEGTATTLRSLGTVIVPAAGVAAALAAPIIGGAIAAAVAGGVGLGGIVGGIILAAQNPVIKSAAASLKDSFVSGLKIESEVFVGPIMRSIEIVRGAMGGITDKIGKIFQNLAPYVEPLVRGLTAMGDAILNGLVAASGQAGPVLKQLAQSLVDIGEAVGRAFQSITEDGDSAARNLKLITDTIAGTIIALGDMIGFLNKVGGHPAFRLLIGDTKGAIAAMIQMKGATEDTAPAVAQHASKMSAAARAARGERAALSDLSKELRAQIDPAFGLLNAQQKMRDAQNDVTAATRKFGRESPQARAAVRRLAEAAIDMAGAAGAAAGVTGGKLPAAMLRTLHAAGATKGQIAAVQREFNRAASAGNRFARTYTAHVVTTFTTRGVAIRGAGSIGGGLSQFAHGGITGAASGGLRGNLTLVGEDGPELAELPPSTRVHPAGRTRAMLDTATPGPPGTTINLNGTINLHGVNDPAALVRALQQYVRQNGPIRRLTFA